MAPTPKIPREQLSFADHGAATMTPTARRRAAGARKRAQAVGAGVPAGDTAAGSPPGAAPASV